MADGAVDQTEPLHLLHRHLQTQGWNWGRITYKSPKGGQCIQSILCGQSFCCKCTQRITLREACMLIPQRRTVSTFRQSSSAWPLPLQSTPLIRYSHHLDFSVEEFYLMSRRATIIIHVVIWKIIWVLPIEQKSIQPHLQAVSHPRHEPPWKIFITTSGFN